MTSEAFSYPRGATAANPACRILVVDDSPDAVKFLSRFLESKGHDVQTARNGTEALVVAAAFFPDVVLLDLGLPGLDGVHVGKQLKQSARPLLLIALTGRSQPEDYLLTQQAGFDHHLVKPIDLNSLEGLIQESVVMVGERCSDDTPTR